MQSKGREMDLFSWSFHKHIFLPLVFDKLKRKREKGSPSIGGGLPLEYTLLSWAALGIMLFGFFHYQSMIGLTAGLAGACGFFALLIGSVKSQLESEQKPSLEHFRLAPFLFLILLGIATGLFFAADSPRVLMKALAAIGGFITGYMLGIPAGIWIQAIGWMATVIEILLWPAMIALMLLSTFFMIA